MADAGWRGAYKRSASVAWVAIVVTAIDSITWRLLFGMRNRTMACGVGTLINLVIWLRNADTTS